MDKKLNKYIGQKIDVFDKDGNVEKTITVKDVRETRKGIFFYDEDDEPYEPDELDLPLRLTPEFILYTTLADDGIIDKGSKYDFEIYEKAFSDFMELMEKSGYVARKD